MKNAAVTRAGNGTQVRRLGLKVGELTSEVIRLLIQNAHQERLSRSMDAGTEQFTCELFQSMFRGGDPVFVADNGRRLSGLLHFCSRPVDESRRTPRVWDVMHLMLAEEASDDICGQLLVQGLEALDAGRDFLVARIPASEARSIRGLKAHGFEVVAGEAIGVAPVLDRDPPRSGCVIPLRQQHLEQAFRLMCQCPHSSSLSYNRELSLSMYENMIRLQLQTAIDSPDHHPWALPDARGGLAVIGDLLVEPHRSSLARIQFLCARSAAEDRRREKRLLKLMRFEAHRLGARAVMAGTLINDNGSLARIRLLRQAGFTMAATNLVLHRFQRRETRVPCPESLEQMKVLFGPEPCSAHPV